MIVLLYNIFYTTVYVNQNIICMNQLHTMRRDKCYLVLKSEKTISLVN